MHMRIYKIAAINLGSTSTKIAYYENENCVFKDNIVHTARALEGFSTIWEQFEFRKQAIEAYLKEKGILISGLDAVVTRGAVSYTHLDVYKRQVCASGLPGSDAEVMQLLPYVLKKYSLEERLMKAVYWV